MTKEKAMPVIATGLIWDDSESEAESTQELFFLQAEIDRRDRRDGTPWLCGQRMRSKRSTSQNTHALWCPEPLACPLGESSARLRSAVGGRNCPG